MSAKKKLPAPRIQLRWVESTATGWAWECHYELVIKLDKYDIRAEVYKGERLLKKRRSELVVPIKKPSVRSGGGIPCTWQKGERYFDSPYRDGAHANWDAKQLGDLPVYVIAPDGMSFKDEGAAA